MAQSIAGLGDRVRHVRLALAPALGGNVSLARFGALVAEEIKGQKAFHASTAMHWEEGAELGTPVIAAIVRLAQRHGLRYVTRAWLAFGPDGVSEAIDAPTAPEIAPSPQTAPVVKPGRGGRPVAKTAAKKGRKAG